MSDSPISSYEGERNEVHERHGQGKAAYTNGDVYVGEFVIGKRSGIGTYNYIEEGKTVATYTGSWIDGNKQGKGKFAFMNSGYFEGEFLNGNRHGQGIYYYSNEDYYEGEWKDNKKHGAGKYFKFDSKIVISGNWEDGVIKGTVKVLREDAVLEGNVENGTLKKYSFLTIDGATIAVE